MRYDPFDANNWIIGDVRDIKVGDRIPNIDGFDLAEVTKNAPVPDLGLQRLDVVDCVGNEGHMSYDPDASIYRLPRAGERGANED